MVKRGEKMPFIQKFLCALLFALCCNAFAAEGSADADSCSEKQVWRCSKKYKTWQKYAPKDVHAPKAFEFRIGAMYPTAFEASVMGFRGVHLVEINDRWRFYVGYDPFHVTYNEKGFSDETVVLAAAAVAMAPFSFIYQVIKGSDSRDYEEEMNDYYKEASLPKIIFFHIPTYIWCGNLYFPLVEGSWLGLNDQSHVITHLIEDEGFHWSSFTYTNDISLRFSKKERGRSGSFVDVGVRLEKNFADSFKARIFAQIGVFGSG